MAQANPKALQSSLSKLQISSTSKAIPKVVKNAEPADSWEDDADSAGSDDEGSRTPVLSDASPRPPPPTPSSPSQAIYPLDASPYHILPSSTLDGAFGSTHSSASDSTTRRDRDGDAEERRPDKSTAVASRLIAAGIGQKAPKRTKEQREYDQALKIQEKKKRDQAKEDETRKQREKEQAMKDIWGD